MRTLRAVAVAVLSTVVLAGCGPSGPGGGDDPAPKPSTEPGTSASASADPSTGASTGPSTDATAGPTASPTAGQVPAPGETLVRVTRTGGFAGRTHTLVVKGDGSFTRLDAEAKPTGTGKLSGAELARLSTALREADFARLPRVATGGPTIYDGFSYVFVHDGHEVAGDQGSLPEALTKVLDALPPFTGG
ncbi:hypothetical protein Snoj_82470 [Streptomyces nojiriensis]|uniref:Lipoprotein n=1 Tax=Streptomyces nojiriensis TaxID=66374 RepID=A0ABQ3T1Q7_9ACTN|nr:hypothetical protein [Streptomyces nojiriensis]QTI47820.1 hypothetical protein JYK04_05671 [Streptomyces nojiriensis]GGS15501.1 hypothetical protein GCM10010205_51790 [Streptomyces nojiriensis]GHI74329.1 hypothetical protein Snoj_82470 [Streptomyces nojiriensis]